MVEPLVIVFVVIVIILVTRASPRNDRVDQSSVSYRQGYWDGVCAAELGEAHTPEQPTDAGALVTIRAAEANPPDLRICIEMERLPKQLL